MDMTEIVLKEGEKGNKTLTSLNKIVEELEEELKATKEQLDLSNFHLDN